MGKCFWFFGLSGAGKTTLCKELIKNHSYIHLDGDEIRQGVNWGLNFSDEGRLENIRRAAEIAKLLVNQNFIVLCSFITPLISHRKVIKKIVPNVKLIYLECSIKKCIERDPKGNYAKQIENYTGVDGIFETPLDEIDITLNTEKITINENVNILEGRYI